LLVLIINIVIKIGWAGTISLHVIRVVGELPRWQPCVNLAATFSQSFLALLVTAPFTIHILRAVRKSW